ncbi:MAG TPA: glycosyltransferase, partial [Paludibacteraceae bacterium]|nr:glycosyltransferase [Paludibacteraceae bacterium]
IIIPVYGGFESLKKTVLSIQCQSFVHLAKQKIQVVIVNDGSESKLTKSMLNSDDLDINIINIEKNLGRVYARNVGVSVAKFNKLIFLDSDVVLPSNYVYEMYIRLCLIPNAVLISFKECLDPSNPELENQNIIKGIRKPSNFQCDWRVNCYINEAKKGLRKINESNFRNIVMETNGLKNFGFNRFIGIFDLAATVATHNVAMSKSLYKAVDGFDTDFTGWGLEDTHFGYKLIASGAMIIPVVSTGIFHIDHPPRSGSEEEKWNEFAKNLETLKNKLNE